ncbi:pyruvate kinase 2, cytosolic-like isoform X2 [Wolffia australiana]
MHSGQAMVEESMRMSSILAASKSNAQGSFPSMTKIVGTLGPKSRSVEIIEACLIGGMSVARFDFSWLDVDYHQETVDNLRKAMKNVRKLCAVMMDTMGPELQVFNRSGNPIELKEGDYVKITPDTSQDPTNDILPVNYNDLATTVKKGDTIFVGQYLFTGSESTSVWLEVSETEGQDVLCLVKNSAKLSGFIFTLHVAQVHINLPTLTNMDKKAISVWGCRNNIDIISMSYTRQAEDVRELRAFLSAHNLPGTQIFAKIENVEGLRHFDEILKEADGIILSRGNLGIDLPPEKVFLFQKSAVYKCNMAGKPAIITRVVDSMTDNLRPTRAEATDVANAVLDGTDAILLGAETLRGLYPIDAIKTVRRICFEAESVYNQPVHFKAIVKHMGDPMSDEESVASAAVGSAIKVNASVILVFTSSGRAARMIAKYRPPMPILAVVIPRITTNSLRWRFSGAQQARQCLAVRGVYPILADLNSQSAQAKSLLWNSH